ncbi:MAG: hypothetical protein A6F70_08970 [Cycloclasticus sp. symbiont of Bathymodiolus heckerae]|nr:MAG: hypothetical protein A6F70_08970 [Cycloclasticus sp. symbiont of Bathymodiolus heckerae]
MIKNTTKIVLAATATLLLAACSEAPRTTDWYIQHTHAQADKNTYCIQNPDISNEANCIAAAEAELTISKGNEAIKAYLKSKGLERKI